VASEFRTGCGRAMGGGSGNAKCSATLPASRTAPLVGALAGASGSGSLGCACGAGRLRFGGGGGPRLPSAAESSFGRAAAMIGWEAAGARGRGTAMPDNSPEPTARSAVERACSPETVRRRDWGSGDVFCLGSVMLNVLERVARSPWCAGIRPIFLQCFGHGSRLVCVARHKCEPKPEGAKLTFTSTLAGARRPYYPSSSGGEVRRSPAFFGVLGLRPLDRAEIASRPRSSWALSATQC